jgi:surfeit locus 1 family protein
VKRRWAPVALAALGIAGLVALGVWQLERREWKLALIERVEHRIHAAPIAAPAPPDWPSLDRQNSEYLRVTATGHFLQGRETLVRAVTTLGGGFWVLAPFQADAGFIVLVNRGFVPPEQRDPATRNDAVSAGEATTITGLVRITEPGGGFLRANVPADERWYSRDVAAISHARKLSGTAPYFIDAEAGPESAPHARDAEASPESTPQSSDAEVTPESTLRVVNASAGASRMPVGGLTVVTFRNNHLLYAVTWFGLALMLAALAFRMARHR